MTNKEVNELCTAMIGAIRSIAHGDVRAPGGLEGLAMAIAGSGFDKNLCKSIEKSGGDVQDGLCYVAEALDNVADALGAIAKAIEANKAGA